jgi:hypothetical protein
MDENKKAAGVDPAALVAWKELRREQPTAGFQESGGKTKSIGCVVPNHLCLVLQRWVVCQIICFARLLGRFPPSATSARRGVPVGISFPWVGAGKAS